MSLTNKIDFAVIFKVKNSNPNGDPLDGNRPRSTYDGLGEVSDVCIKRKIRDRLMESGNPVFVQSDDRKNDECASLRDRAKILDEKKSSKERAELACRTWMDVRAFGQLFAFKATESKKPKGRKDTETEVGGGEDKGVSIGIRGPVTVQSAFSVEKINITSTQITKSVSGEGDGTKRGSDTMGMKHRVDSGIYVFYGSMNPQLAEKTCFSDEDAAKIKEVLPKLFENDDSAARPAGSMRVLKVIWWKHASKHGQFSSARVHDSLHVQADGSCTLSDIDGLHPEVIDGF